MAAVIKAAEEPDITPHTIDPIPGIHFMALTAADLTKKLVAPLYNVKEIINKILFEETSIPYIAVIPVNMPISIGINKETSVNGSSYGTRYRTN